MSMSLQMTGVTKVFGGLVAVDKVSITVPPLKVTGLIGPNGAGKSTMINMMSGYASITSGTVHVGDVDVTRMAPSKISRLGVARTFQTVRLFREMTVAENISVGLMLHHNGGRRRVREGLDRLLEIFDLVESRDQLAVTLPYGAQRRLEMARAICREPSVLLLDEPAAGMTDPESEELGRRIRSIAADGVAVLLVEHNTRLVGDICDFVYVLSEGRVLAEGGPDSVMANVDVVAAYLGEELD